MSGHMDMAAVIAELQAKLDAAEKRVAELERYVKSLAVFDMPPADSVAEWPWQWRMYGIRSEACELMGIEDQ